MLIVYACKNGEKPCRCSSSYYVQTKLRKQSSNSSDATSIMNGIALYFKLVILTIGSAEEKFAKHALFSRHPVMKSWPKDHGKLNLRTNI